VARHCRHWSPQKGKRWTHGKKIKTHGDLINKKGEATKNWTLTNKNWDLNGFNQQQWRFPLKKSISWEIHSLLWLIDGIHWGYHGISTNIWVSGWVCARHFVGTQCTKPLMLERWLGTDAIDAIQCRTWSVLLLNSLCHTLSNLREQKTMNHDMGSNPPHI
jgi:hypothetical protein